MGSVAGGEEMKLTARILEFVIGALFIYTGALKAWDPITFASDIDHYHIVPWRIAALLAFYLPWLEIFCGVALIVRRAATGALAVLAALMAVFIAVSVIAKARGIDISCGCFGHVARDMSFGWHMALDVALLIVIALLTWRSVRHAAPVPFRDR